MASMRYSGVYSNQYSDKEGFHFCERLNRVDCSQNFSYKIGGALAQCPSSLSSLYTALTRRLFDDADLELLADTGRAD